MIHVGYVREIVRYPVKSMAGIATESAMLGWHGLDGDRRFAFRRMGDSGGFPWLTASRLPELLLYQPIALDQSTGEPIELDQSTGEPLPTHVRTPAGLCLELRGAELKAEIGERLGSEVELMKLNHGMFDEATVSVISLATIAGISHEVEHLQVGKGSRRVSAAPPPLDIAREVGVDLDRRRFRANIYVETEARDPFLEDAWVGGTLVFGDSDPRPAVSVTMRDVRCVMINIDPDTAEQDARIMKTVVRLNQNNAGVYATVVRPGLIHVGDRVSLVRETAAVK
ncbi:MAG TPA: MOSC N-terminal beta barrel domain-containing protein [Pyrinomonadaceae bacterium]|nr:MOSC N-terminal beta barrel domain-containing protein [Pyrinomonadaceae bacterium]